MTSAPASKQPQWLRRCRYDISGNVMLNMPVLLLETFECVGGVEAEAVSQETLLGMGRYKHSTRDPAD